MTLPKWTPFLFLLVFLAACSTDTVSQPPAGPDIAGNNAAVLVGAPLGSGERDVQQLRKEVPVNLATPNPDFELGTFSATRQSVNTEELYWILPITNVSDQTRCFVKAVNLSFQG